MRNDIQFAITIFFSLIILAFLSTFSETLNSSQYLLWLAVFFLPVVAKLFRVSGLTRRDVWLTASNCIAAALLIYLSIRSQAKFLAFFQSLSGYISQNFFIFLSVIVIPISSGLYILFSFTHYVKSAEPGKTKEIDWYIRLASITLTILFGISITMTLFLLQNFVKKEKDIARHKRIVINEFIRIRNTLNSSVFLPLGVENETVKINGLRLDSRVLDDIIKEGLFDPERIQYLAQLSTITKRYDQNIEFSYRLVAALVSLSNYQNFKTFIKYSSDCLNGDKENMLKYIEYLEKEVFD